MKKHLSYLILIALAGLTACKTDSKTTFTDLDQHGLKGNVLSVSYANYTAVEENGKVTKGPAEEYGENTTFRFNENGLVAEEINMLSNGTFVERLVYEYDENQKMMDVKVYTGDNVLTVQRLYTWDGDFIATMEDYDAEGNLIERFEKENNGEYITKNIKYKADGSIEYTDETIKEGEGKFQTTNYDADGNRMSVVNIEKTGELINKMTTEDCSLTTTVVCSMDIKRNKKGEEIEIENGKMEGPNLNMLRGAHMTYEYHYDKNGNWIERIEFDADKKPLAVTQREITYSK